MTYDLVIVGEINPDLILRGTDLRPAFGQAEKLVDHADLTIGSSAVITACGAAKLGLKTAFVGVVGDDIFGRFMLTSMQEKNVDTSYCITDATQATGFSIILSEPADRAILTYAGSISSLHYEDINLNLFEDAKHVHLSSYFLLDALRPHVPKLFKSAKAKGLTTSLDTNWDPRETWDDGLNDVLDYTDVFLPNQAEALQISKQTTLEAAVNILATRVSTLAVKLGAEGGLVQQDVTKYRSAVFPVDLVDTTGAGDSFNAGFLYGTLQSWPLELSLQFACACGSLSTRAAGGTSAQASLAEALSLLESR
ncbi:MAG: sugar kinase [Deinococcota bacterium]